MIAALDARPRRSLKFFPAEQLGGLARSGRCGALSRRALRADRRDQRRDAPPTSRCPPWLAVGGSWLVAPDAVAGGRFAEIARLAAAAVALGAEAAR